LSPASSLRIRDVAVYLRVSHQRAAQMYAKWKLPEPEKVNGIGAAVEASGDRAMGRAGVVGNAAVEQAAENQLVEGGPPQCPQARRR
jgi:hypothetical protein